MLRWTLTRAARKNYGLLDKFWPGPLALDHEPNAPLFIIVGPWHLSQLSSFKGGTGHDHTPFLFLPPCILTFIFRCMHESHFKILHTTICGSARELGDELLSISQLHLFIAIESRSPLYPLLWHYNDSIANCCISVYHVNINSAELFFDLNSWYLVMLCKWTLIECL